MSSSVGKDDSHYGENYESQLGKLFPIEWKVIKAMFQTTNQQWEHHGHGMEWDTLYFPRKA